MTWPVSQDYNEAIQDPQASFADPELRVGEAACNALGMPMPRSGNFADVYEFTCPTSGKWAVKCFTRCVAGLRERYSEISRCLQAANLPFAVEFQYLDQGIRVRGQWYPILKMRWIEGLLLNDFIRANLDKPALLGQLNLIWGRMAKRLREAGIAHCDLQHGNVLLVPGSKTTSLAVKLIDYDGMFVPTLAQTKSGEVGHPNYQHPQRLRDGIYKVEVDRFPLLVVGTALQALSVGGRSLWERYDNGDNLLFKETDLRAPGQSALFGDLLKMTDRQTRLMVESLWYSCQANLEETPLIESLLPDLKVARERSTAVAVKGTAAAESNDWAFDEKAAGGRRRRLKVAQGGRLWLWLGGLAVVVVLAVVGILAFSDGSKSPKPGASTNAKNKKAPDSPRRPVEAEPIYLANLQEMDFVGFGKLGKGAINRGQAQILVADVLYPKGLGTHPPSNGFASVKYKLNKKMRRFSTTAAINDSAARLLTPLTFTVAGDGRKVSWVSEPLRKGMTAKCSMDISGIDILELRVDCPGRNDWAHAVWLDPMVEEADKSDTGVKKSNK